MRVSASAHAASVPRRIATVFVPFALAYFLSYLYRTVNAVIADELTASLGVTAAGLGLLTSAYFIAFGAFQPVLGILLDRYGPRTVESALLLVGALGAAVFALGDSLGMLAAGRALIGLGVSACLMAAITANVMWWPAERLPMVNGLFMACGGLGAVFATTPVRALLSVTDWRGLFLGLAAATVAAAVLLFTVVPERRREGAGSVGWAAMLRGTAAVFSSRTFWRLAPLATLTQGAFMAYISLWAGPWLRDVDGLDRMAVAAHLQYAALAMVAGFAGFGVAADALRRVGLPPMAVCTAGIALGIAVQLALLAGAPIPPAVAWVLYAFFSASSVMIFAVLSQDFPAALAGRVNTAANLVMFAFAFTLQSAIGGVIGAFAPPAAGGYAPEGHRAALAGVIALEVAALLWQLWPRRTRTVPVVPAQ